MEKPRLVTILSKLSLRYSYRKLGWPKAPTMSYEVLYIANGGVPHTIPLYDFLPTLVTLQLLYDCYIHLSTLELQIYKMLHPICTCTHVRKNRLGQAMQGITNTQTIFVRPTIWHPCDDQWWKTDAKFGRSWWCSCAQLWHLAKANSCLSCIYVHWYGSSIQLIW